VRSVERNPSARWLAPALVALAAAAGGLAAGWFLRGNQSAARPASSPLDVQAADALTAAELEAAKREILAELQRLVRAPRGDSAPGAAPAGAEIAELGRRIDAIDARIALLATGPRPGNAGRDWASARGPGAESLAKIFERIQEWHKRYRKHEDQEDICEVLRKEHNLWAIEDVFRAYGAPDHVSSSSGLALCYGRFALPDEESPCYVYFRILEGYVIEVGFDCSSGW
jgi:hypothetical protein